MPGGRPTKRTPEAREAIILALRNGDPLMTAAAMGGIHYDTFVEWRKADAEFSDAVERAIQYGKHSLVEIVRKAAPKTWQAGAWLLERRWPEDFARREQLTIDLTQHAAKAAEEAGLDPAEVLAEAERIVRAA